MSPPALMSARACCGYFDSRRPLDDALRGKAHLRFIRALFALYSRFVRASFRPLRPATGPASNRNAGRSGRSEPIAPISATAHLGRRGPRRGLPRVLPIFVGPFVACFAVAAYCSHCGPHRGFSRVPLRRLRSGTRNSGYCGALRRFGRRAGLVAACCGASLPVRRLGVSPPVRCGLLRLAAACCGLLRLAAACCGVSLPVRRPLSGLFGGGAPHESRHARRSADGACWTAFFVSLPPQLLM